VNLIVTPLSSADDLDWCARLMSNNDPWRTLRRDYAACVQALENPVKERYIARVDGERAGLLILDMTGPFPGYLQTIAIAPESRNRGVGSQLIAWAEERIFRDSPNVFMCVSSFNVDARRLYERLGYEAVGVLPRIFVEEHDEVLLRKTRGSWASFRQGT
jgi:ribosomal protein S18 acetylase RimI-like enzyme